MKLFGIIAVLLLISCVPYLECADPVVLPYNGSVDTLAVIRKCDGQTTIDLVVQEGGKFRVVKTATKEDE